MDDPKFTHLIKKSNDFWAGWVAVAIWELARWLDIDLDIVGKYTKYAWLSDKELAISESQERMSFVIAKEDYNEFMKLLEEENLEAFQVAEITNKEEKDEDRLVMNYKWKKVVNLSRKFLDKNGAQKKANAKVVMKKVTFFDKLDEKVENLVNEWKYDEAIIAQLSLLQNAMQRWLWGMFDNSVWASNILAPYGWKYQSSPQIWMASKIPTFDWIDAKTAIISTNGFNPHLLSENTYIWWIYSIIEAISKVVAMGGDYSKTWVSLQEYFATLTSDEKYWEVYAWLLWALKALLEVKIASIWWKDSMSGAAKLQDWEKLEVPPTIVTFANTPVDSARVVSAEFKKAWSKVLCFRIEKDSNGLPNWTNYRKNLKKVQRLIDKWVVLSSSVVDQWWIISAISKLTLWNRIWFEFNNFDRSSFLWGIGDIILEVKGNAKIGNLWMNEMLLWKTIQEEKIKFWENNALEITQIQSALEHKLEGVWKTKKENTWPITLLEQYKERTKIQVIDALKEKNENMEIKPKALIPVFPWTNSEMDTKHALIKAGFEVVEHIFYTPKAKLGDEHYNQENEKARLSREKFAELLKETNLLVFPGWFWWRWTRWFCKIYRKYDEIKWDKRSITRIF